MEEGGEAGRAEAGEDEQEWGSLCSAVYQRPSWEREKDPNEEWRVDVPSSIDIRPMGKKGTNAYAQMGSGREANGAQKGHEDNSSMLIIHHLRDVGIMQRSIKQVSLSSTFILPPHASTAPLSSLSLFLNPSALLHQTHRPPPPYTCK